MTSAGRTMLEGNATKSTAAIDRELADGLGCVRGGYRVLERPGVLTPESRPEQTPSERFLLANLVSRRQEVNGRERDVVVRPLTPTTRAAICIALRATEEAGELYLEVGQDSLLFGLVKLTAVRAVRRRGPVRWPDDSLEGQLRLMASTGTGTNVSSVVYGWLGSDSANPWGLAATRLLDGLLRRGLLDFDITRRKLLKVITLTSSHYLLPERPRPAARPLPAAAERERPELSNLLGKEIDRGVNRRRENYD